MTPGVSILVRLINEHVQGVIHCGRDSRLAFEVFHDIQKPVIDIWLIRKLDLDLIEVTECVLQISC